MAKITALRTLSSGELRARIPALEQAAASSAVGKRNAARAELAAVRQVLDARDAARESAAEAEAAADAAWQKVAALEADLIAARVAAEAADRAARDALLAAFGE